MAAAGVGPQASAVVFVQSAPMKQQFTLAVEHKNAERSVQDTFAVGFHFLHGAQWVIFWIYEDDIFDHELRFLRFELR